MQKIKFDFEATKERIYAPNSNVPIGAPVDRNGNIANDGNAYGIVLCKETENEKYWVRYNLVVMVAGYCDIIDAQEIWGDEYSAEAIAAMSDIIFCDDHKIGGGGGWPADLPKPSVGGYGHTEQGEQVIFDDNLLIDIRSPAEGGFYSVIDIDPLEVGETYNIVWNGVEYICECVGGEVAYIGNASIIGAPAETDEPFVFIVEEGSVLVVTSTSGTYSIKLSKNSETVHKIDEKYLPEAGGATFYVTTGDENIYTDENLEEYLTNNVALATDGRPVYLKNIDDGKTYTVVKSIYGDSRTQFYVVESNPDNTIQLSRYVTYSGR